MFHYFHILSQTYCEKFQNNFFLNRTCVLAIAYILSIQDFFLLLDHCWWGPPSGDSDSAHDFAAVVILTGCWHTDVAGSPVVAGLSDVFGFPIFLGMPSHSFACCSRHLCVGSVLVLLASCSVCWWPCCILSDTSVPAIFLWHLCSQHLLVFLLLLTLVYRNVLAVKQIRYNENLNM